MQRQLFNLHWMIIFLFILAASPAFTLASEEPRLQLSAKTLNIAAGQDVVVEMHVENIPPIYGAESHLAFDPEFLEVIGLAHGDFMADDPDQETFVLQNQFDNDAGTIDYALALLHPAPPAAGDGLLATVTFRAKANGVTTIDVTEALFGSQSGDEFAVTAEGAELTVEGTILEAQSQATDEQIQSETGLFPITPEIEAEIDTDEDLIFQNSQNTSESIPANSNPQPFQAEKAAETNLALPIKLSLLGLGVMIVLGAVISFIGIIGVWIWLRSIQQGSLM